MTPKIVAISDLHFGHIRVPSSDTANDIRRHLFPQLDASVDMLTISGDVFDRLISMNQNDSLTVLELFTDIFKICAKYDIVLRIVRGTFSHDHRQLDFIYKLYCKLDLVIDYRSFDTLFLEYIKRFDIHILYIPDNLPYATKEDVLENIHMFLKASDIKAVDYVIMHGELSHLIFGHINPKAFHAEDFDQICKRFVISGHIHKPLFYKKTISVGSFNRLAHNEEEQKGFWIIQEQPKFVPNKTATIFRTINCTKIATIEELLEKYTSVANELDPDRLSFIRVIIRDIHIKHTLSRYNDTQYPNIRLTFKTSPIKDNLNDTFLYEKLAKKQDVTLEIPSLANVASIVFNDLQRKGIFIDIKDIRYIIHDTV